MDVNFLCNFNPTGVGRHCENSFFGVLRNRRNGLVPLYVNAQRAASVERLCSQACNKQGATLCFWRWPLEAMRTLPGRKIGWLFFESDAIPPLWREQMLAFDQLWMPSDWGREVLVAHGIAEEKIRVVPAGVDPRIFFPNPVAHERFVFLIVGKYEKRKSIDEAIQAFVLEFPRDRYHDVEFCIKADHLNFPDRIAALRARHGGDARLRFVSGLLSDQQMAVLYNQADAFVFPTKAEGFGLPCVEAMACGLPVITTPYSAQQVFLKHVGGLFYPVSFDLARLEDPDYEHFYGAEYQGTPYGRWAVPQLQSIRAGMRAVYEDRTAWRQRAMQASVKIRQTFSWDEIGRCAVDVLLEQTSGKVS